MVGRAHDREPVMLEQGTPRTRLAQILRQRHLTLAEFRRQYERAAGAELSQRQAYRWVAGELRGLPYPHAQRALERLFGEPAARLLGAPYGTGAVAPVRRHDTATPSRGSTRTDWEGQVITVSADRARDFLSRAEASNVGPETLGQLADDLRRLSVAYLQRPLPELLGDFVEVQQRAFGLLEGRQRPKHTRQLYVLAGVASCLMAKASHDLGALHDAMTQARVAYACAVNADHTELRASVRSVQSGLAYWAGCMDDAVRYAQHGINIAGHGWKRVRIWLRSAESRAWAALGHTDNALAAIIDSHAAWEHVEPAEEDDLGGKFAFTRPRHLYLVADAWARMAASDPQAAERAAVEALAAIDSSTPESWGWSTVAGVCADLAIARIALGELEGAAEAMTSVLRLPPARRIHAVAASAERVHSALRHAGHDTRENRELQDAITEFCQRPLMQLSP